MNSKFLCLLFVISRLSPYASADWMQTNGPCGGSVRCFALSGANVLAATDGGVFLSTNNGTNWTRNSLAGTIVSFAVSGPNLYACGIGYVYLSTNSGTSWTPVSGFLFALTNTGHLCRSNQIIASVRGSDNPQELRLEQDYPNPFNPSATIRYVLPTRAHVVLSVFNLLGQQASVLESETEEAGYHDVRFDGSRLAR
jgi:hypothetical protein